MSIKNPLYYERLNRFNTAVAKGKPDIVPVFPIMELYLPLAAGISVKDCYTKSPSYNVEALKRVADEVYMDVCRGTGNLIPLNLISKFGEGLYTVTDTQIQIKGSQGCTMDESEYEELLVDPQRFIVDKIIPRKYDVFNKSSDSEIAKLWLSGMAELVKYMLYEAKANHDIEEKLGIPSVAKGSAFLPPDMMLDFLRDFVGTSKDIKKRPEEFFAACNALYPLTKRMAELTDTKADKSTMVFMPLHLPTYLRPNDFGKLYWPFMKRMAKDLIDSGRTPFFFCENDWSPYLDYFEDFPDGDILCLFEHGDLSEYKKKIGHKVAISGGMPVKLLKSGTKEDCLDRAKWCLDNLAPDGGYVFGVDQTLLSPSDVKLENFAAVCQYIHENGKY